MKTIKILVNASKVALILLFSTMTAFAGVKIELGTEERMKIDVGDFTIINDDVLILYSDGKEKDVKAGYGKVSNPAGASAFIRSWGTESASVTRSMESNGDTVILDYDFTLAPECGAKSFALIMHLQRALMDIDKSLIPSGPFSSPITLHTLVGRMTLDPSGSEGGAWHLEDYRNLDWCKQFRLRFSGTVDSSQPTIGKARLTIRIEPEIPDYFVTLPLNEAATRPLKDNAAHEGWSGQGGINDMSTLPSGILQCAGVPFQVTERGILLQGTETPDFPETSGLMEFEEPMSLDTFYFLQTGVWGTSNGNVVATYHVYYEDGSEEDIPVHYFRDVADWWKGFNVSNAKIAWTGPNMGGQPVCVYMMRAANPHPERKVTALELVSANTQCTLALIAITALHACQWSGVSEMMPSTDMSSRMRRRSFSFFGRTPLFFSTMSAAKSIALESTSHT